MDRLDKCLLAVKKGFKYNAETGDITGVSGNIIRKKVNGYIALTLWYNGKRYYLFGHQFAWFVLYKEIIECIDHKNRIKTDNREANLRNLTKQQNALNTNSIGCSLDKRNGKWASYIAVGGRKKHLGYFSTTEEASRRTKQEKDKILKHL